MMPTHTTATLLHALDEVSPLVRREAAAADRDSALSGTVTSWLARHGLFRLWVPHRYDGLELSLPDALSIYAAAARIDGAFGWAVMIGAGGGLFAAYLEPATAHELFGAEAAVIAGSGAPHGRAERVAGGYRVQGRWRFASGAPYATTFTANCVVTGGGEAVLKPNGEPLVRAMAFPRTDVAVVETWDAAGMRATASHDFVVDEVFVPESRSFSVLEDLPREPGPLYRLPFQVVTELPVAAVALGIARHALDAFAALAASKKPYGAAALLAESALTQDAFAQSHATWHMVQSAVLGLAERTWSAAVEGQGPSLAQSAEITATCAHGVTALRATTDALVALAGMAGIERTSALGRASRDLSTLAAHFSVSARQRVAAGEALLHAAADRSQPKVTR